MKLYIMIYFVAGNMFKPGGLSGGGLGLGGAGLGGNSLLQQTPHSQSSGLFSGGLGGTPGMFQTPTSTAGVSNLEGNNIRH